MLKIFAQHNKCMSRKILIINIINQNRISIQIKNASMETEDEYLTPGQGSDNMLIRLLDKILLKNKIKKFQFKFLKVHSESTTTIFGDYISIHLIKDKPI